MDTSLLHILRTLSRRLGGALALLLLWSNLVALTAAPARAMPSADLPMEHHAMMEHHTMAQHHPAGDQADRAIQQTPPPPPHTTHHHGDGACCLAGQSCSGACSLSLVASPLYADIQVVQWPPFDQRSAQAVTRPLQPPRRPPKA